MPASDAGEHTALAQQLAEAVREAGALALAMFGTGVKTWTKGHGSPVSEADIAVNDLLRARLSAIAPEIAWLSEESPDDPARASARRVWVVDPIDGTRAYIAGRTDALVENGRPVAAALFAPAEPAFYFAVAGEGASLDGASIAASGGESLDGIRVAGPKSCLERLAALEPRIEAVPRIHSIALRFARVACGMLDAAFSAGSSHDWDLAAADLLVHEAGGALTTLAGRQLAYNRAELVHGALLVAGSARQAKLLGLMRTGCDQPA